jgi:large subunit ribosomal protein L6
MSRIGKLPIQIPKNIKIYKTPRQIQIYGPYGVLIQNIPKNLYIFIKLNILYIKTTKTTKQISQEHGLIRSLVKNKILGVIKPFKKTLVLIGVGYRAILKNQTLILKLGYSHKTFIVIPDNLFIQLDNHIYITIQGINKEIVCLFISKIRSLKPPEPYKGKGIKYLNEIIKRKIGKSNKL